AAGGALGPIIPPSITLILYAGLTQTSVNQLFAASTVPGVALGLVFMLWSSWVCRRHGYAKAAPEPMAARLKAFKEAFLALLTPVIVIGGMFGGLFTATEAAAVASFYVMILGFFVFRTLKVRDLPGVFWNTVEQTAKVMFVIATAGFFQYVLLYTRIPQQAIAFISSSFTTIAPVLCIIIGLLVVMGCFMEGTAILLVTVPIFVPLAKSFGYDVTQLGVVMCVALAVGVLTPPVGLNLYVMASVTGEKVMAIARDAVGYVVLMIIAALAVAFVPELSLGLAGLVD
ncbi:MAG: TRAP transporter large permease, partial [Duodenibacillus sp.]|nr:TRAP transporter large permease [Duodenibacillus sp.]